MPIIVRLSAGGGADVVTGGAGAAGAGAAAAGATTGAEPWRAGSICVVSDGSVGIGNGTGAPGRTLERTGFQARHLGVIVS
jgi:hypothetical protein